MTLEAINILAGDLSSYVAQHVEDDVDGVRRSTTLDQAPSLRVEPTPGSALWMEFEQRRVLELVYAQHPTERWEIISDQFRRGDGQARSVVQCRPLWARLGDQVAYLTLSDGSKETDLSHTAVPVETALDRILGSSYNAPALFSRGTIAPALQGEIVNTFVSAGTHQEHLAAVADDLRAEWTARWDDGAGEYKIDLLERIGDSDPTNRTIREREDQQGDTVNRLSLRDRQRTDQFFSALLPLSGQDDQTRTMAGARFPIDTATYDSGANRTTITLENRAFWKDGVLLRAKVTDGSGDVREVQSTTRPDVLTVAGDVSDWSVLLFLDAGGDDLIELTDTDAANTIGERTKAKRFSNVAPYENLLERGGVNAAADTLTGWAALGSNTALSIASGRDYSRHGDGAIKVETTAADEEEGVRSSSFVFDPEEEGPTLSVHVALRVQTGRLQVQLVDSEGTEYPPDQTIEGGEDTLRGYTIQGAQPAAGTIFLKVTKLEPDTTFYLDAAVVAPTSTAVQYAPYMGPRGLWQRGADHMAEEGGLPSRTFDGEVVDLSVLENTGEELMLGDAATVKLHDGTDVEARITSTEKELSAGSPSTVVRVTLGEPMEGVLDRFIDPDPPPPPGDGGGGTPRVEPVITDVDRYQDGGTGTVEFRVSDPLNIVTAVEARTKEGANFDPSDSWTQIGSGAGSYSLDVGLVAKHNSFVELALRTGPQVDEVFRKWTFDIDTVPNGQYQVKWSWNESRGTVEAEILAVGDEDTKSFLFELDKGNDDTVDNTIQVDAQSTTELLNPSVVLSPGDTIGVLAEAYSEPGQGGTAEQTPFDETFEVPTFEATLPDVRPSVSAKAQEDPKGTGRVTFTVEDPDGLVEDVETRTSAGDNLSSSDDFDAPTVSDSSPYEETVSLEDGHNSFVEVRLTTSSGENVRRVFTFDPDTSPEADYSLQWRWNQQRGSAELRVVATGDDDVESFFFGLDADQDGTNEETHAPDATATTQLINSTTTLSPGESVRVQARAYATAGQQGEEEENSFDEVIEVPTFEATSPDRRPSITIETYDQQLVNGQEKGVLHFTVDDPDGLLTQVDARTADGRNLDSGDGFSQVSPTDGTYEVEVGLAEQHDSFVEVALRVGGDLDDVRRVFSFDADRIPDASYQVEWQWNESRDTIECVVIGRGDEDTASYLVGVDPDQDNTLEDSAGADGRSADLIANPSVSLMPGQSIRVQGEAYGQTGQGGTVEADPLDVVVEVPPVQETLPAEERPTINATTSTSGSTGEVEWTVEDPDALMEDVEVRTASGRNLQATDDFAPPTDDTSPYSETVAIDPKHNSFIEVRVVTPSAVENVRQVFVFDADVTPEGSIQVRWFYDSTLPGIAAEVIATGDDDVQSWELFISDGDNDSEIHTVNAQSPTQQLNTSFGLDPGTEVTIGATAYAQQDGQGESTQVVNGTYVTMADVDAIADADGVVIEGKHILLDGATSVKGSLDVFPALSAGHPSLQRAVAQGGLKARVTFDHPNRASGSELTDPIEGRRYKLRGGANLVDDVGPHSVALYLDGNGAYLPVEHSLSSTSPNHFVAGWFRVPKGQGLGSTNVLWSYDASEYDRVYVDGNGVLKIRAFGTTYSSESAIVDSTWHHLQVAWWAQETTTRLLIYIDGQLVLNQDIDNANVSWSGTTRYLMIGVGSEAGSYDGTTGPADFLELYCQDLLVGKGWQWDNEEAIPAFSNPMGGQPTGTVHGDLLVEGTVRSQAIDVDEVFANTIQFTGSLHQQQSGNTLFAITAGENRRVYIADDAGNTTALLSKSGNLSINKISGYRETASSAADGGGESVPSGVKEYMQVETENGAGRVPVFDPPDTTPPSAPTNLSASDNPDFPAVDLNWDAVSAGDLDGYRVYRSQQSGGPYSQIRELEVTSTTDGDVTAGTTYYYVVTAFDESGNESGYSNESVATPTESDDGTLQ